MPVALVLILVLAPVDRSKLEKPQSALGAVGAGSRLAALGSRLEGRIFLNRDLSERISSERRSGLCRHLLSPRVGLRGAGGKRQEVLGRVALESGGVGRCRHVCWLDEDVLA